MARLVEELTGLALEPAARRGFRVLSVRSGSGAHRIGLQPGPDGLGRAVAGPRHSSLRELVEARRVHDRLDERLAQLPAGSHVVVRCAPADETRTRGAMNGNVRALRAAHSLAELRIVADPELPRGTLAVDTSRDSA